MTKNIKSERVRIGMTQEQLADEIGVHVNSIRMWENGTSLPSAMNLINMSHLFKCSPDYLLGCSEERLAVKHVL